MSEIMDRGQVIEWQLEHVNAMCSLSEVDIVDSHLALLEEHARVVQELDLADRRIAAYDRAVETALYHPYSGPEIRWSINDVLDHHMPQDPDRVE